jgi:hypothetical protein
MISCTVGQHVSAKYSGNGIVYPATIASIDHSDSTIMVDWDDGDTSYRTVLFSDATDDSGMACVCA